MIPLHDTGAADFAAMREFLRDTGYTIRGVFERTGTSSVADARDTQDQRADRQVGDARDVLIRLFLDERCAAREEVTRVVSDDALRLLERIGLVRSDGDSVLPTAMLYPVDDVWLASDLTRDPANPAATYALPGDAVYPALTRNTSDFLSLLPSTPSRRFLELCGGTGVAAIIAAPATEIAVTADITERSTAFATWNAKLNGRTNVRAARGDLYQAVAGETFDRIVAHPPYMPALEQQFIYRDGGEDGEQVTRRVLAGLAEHLEPGGTFHASCFLTDRSGDPVEGRVRAMLGAAHEEFDILVLTTAASPVTDYYFRIALDGDIPLAIAEQLADRLARQGVESIVLCALLVARHDAPADPVTLRKQRGSRTRPEHLTAALARAHGIEAAPADELLRPRLALDARLTVQHAPTDGRWTATRGVVAVESPFPRRLEAAAELADFLALCDGSRSLPELYAALHADAKIPDEMTASDFATLVRGLLRDGFLEHVE